MKENYDPRLCEKCCSSIFSTSLVHGGEIQCGSNDLSESLMRIDFQIKEGTKEMEQ